MKGSHQRIRNGLVVCGIATAIAVVSPGQSEIMIGVGVAAVEIGKCSEVILSGECRPCLCMQLLPGDRIVSYTATGWPLPYIQRQLGNPVRYPDLATAYREGAVWEHRRQLSGYGAVPRAVVLALRRKFRERIESESALTAQHISSILPLSAAHPPA